MVSPVFLLTFFISLVTCASLPPIEIVGNKFFYSNNGSQFLMKGIAYQQNPVNTTADFVDPLADADACKRDIPYLKQLKTNILRVYALDIEQDHTECMEMLNDAGIYIIADLSSPTDSINRYDPAWNVDLLKRYTGVIDSMANYTNVLGFFAGNEVTNAVNNTEASTFVKAAVRDSKAYIKSKNYRTIPVGYSANDDTDIRVSLADYFACGSNDERADFFGINMYEWCGTSSFSKSGYSTITEEYKDMGIPLFFSEYGCNEVRPRLFQEVGTIYSSQMTDVWSGGIVYMYFEEANNYGLVSVDGNSVSTLADFNNYKSQIASISPTLASVSTNAVTGSGSGTSCPTATSNWEASVKLPPTPDSDFCECASDASGCVVSSDVSTKDYGKLFGTICGLSGFSCDAILANATTGTYGDFSACGAKEQLNVILNQYYSANGKDASACDFSGSASVQKGSTASACASALKAAGTGGSASNSGDSKSSAKASASGSGPSSSSSSSSSPKKNSANKQFSTDKWSIAILMGTSFVVGLGLIVV